MNWYDLSDKTLTKKYKIEVYQMHYNNLIILKKKCLNKFEKNKKNESIYRYILEFINWLYFKLHTI